MSTKRGMKRLVDQLNEDAGRELRVPAEPDVLMQALCDAMARHVKRPIELRFRDFPVGIETSGLTLDRVTNYLVIVERRTTPPHQLVILGHELWHVGEGDCGLHLHVGGHAAAARTGHSDEGASEGTVAAAAARIMLAEEGISEEDFATAAARSASHADSESEAEAFGLLLGTRFRTWMTGPDAHNPVTQDTTAGRIARAMMFRNGPLP
ncbi:toxin [Streptomyces sp. NPDC058256]|uniref:toxin n=1 Tax=Streptomyces sp. NPDC058256 TaxID=3346408 RepID=UPI0036DFEF32